LKLSIDLRIAAIRIPNDAQPNPVMNAIGGTSSIPGLGSRPNAMATSSGMQPNTDARVASHSASAVTSSSVSTGAARIAS